MVPFEVLEVERALYHKALEADLDQTVESAQGAEMLWCKPFFLDGSLLVMFFSGRCQVTCCCDWK